jgi:ATP-dependent helicase/nuclease subunit A
MNERAMPEALIANQHAASDPAVSAWVSANAGSGKTHVLAQRVIRLLLDGTNPTKILCLTFTKAAAANMANRIFGTLSRWIDLGDADLDAEIRKTGARGIDAVRRAQARRLFASALETPGGLKVQTIHGFCTRLLQQFPFEANVAARFHVLEDTQRSQLLEDIRRQVLLDASQQPESSIGRALAAIIPAASDMQFQTALGEAIRERNEIKEWLDDAGGLEPAAAQLSSALGLKPGDTIESVERAIVEGPHLPSAQWPSAAAICARGSKSDQSQSETFTAALAATGAERIETYLSVFLTDAYGPRKTVITAGLAKSEAVFAQLIANEQSRVHTLCEQRRAVLARDRTLALLALALEVIDRYAARKNREGFLDYDDLIARTRDMLDRVESAWVHYKLDLGIDHVLIDEAQDTSPPQWHIIKRFVAEFTAGAGARGGLKRSIFAVGDDKQSIFSFQDAAPAAFTEMLRFFQLAHEKAGLPFHPIPFKYSFRSAPVVLDAVDAVFRQPAAHTGLTVDPVPTVHEAVRAAAPGLVELWALMVPEDKPNVDPWDQPFDTQSPTSPSVKLARQIAATVKVWLDRGDLIGDDANRRAVRAGDVLILVRQRGALFEAVIRALKQSGIPVAGADRLVLTEHIAVMDLLILADALLLPADDLALATVLKSPLFGLTEDALFDLAHDRDGALIAALRAKRPEVAAEFDALARSAQERSPFAFYADLLGPRGGRRAFLARLGPEANDAIDEFMSLALDYESRETPSLQGFVAWLRTASAEIKRDMEIARDEVRVMTVHGAKGLEAPLVVLADTTTPPAGPAQYHPRLLPLPAQDGTPSTPDRFVWMPLKKDDPALVARARSVWIAEQENEHRRLLYVAMTRAADRLVVCGAVGENGMPAGCWYQLIEQGLDATGTLVEEPADSGTGLVRRYRKSPLDGIGTSATAPAGREPAPPLPDWLMTKVPAVAEHVPTITPSGFADEPARAGSAPSGEARRRAIARGNAVHRLMQSLPDLPHDRRADVARHYLARQDNDLDEPARDEILRQVLAMLDDRRFAALFAPGSRAEVPIVGRIGDQTVSGTVDRLVVTPDAIEIVDYKSNRPAPQKLADTRSRHPGYVRQLALYRAVLMRLYPGRPVRAALLWTDLPGLQEMPAEVLDEALANLPRGQSLLDAPVRRS